MAIAVTVMMLSVAAVPAVGMLTNSEDASADGAAVTTKIETGAEIFTNETKSYSKLAYIGDSLPVSLDPTVWVHDGNYWYNVNELDTDRYGTYLTYGDTQMADLEIRADVLAKYSSVFTSTSFQLLQVNYQITNDCNITVDVSKTGETSTSLSVDVPKVTAGATISSVKKVSLFTINNSNTPDIPVTNIAGVYNVTVKCDGKECETYQCSCDGEYVLLNGYVKDADGQVITWGRSANDYVLYTVGKDTDEYKASIVNGEYTIEARVGTIVNIVNVIVSNYSFTNHYYSYGEVKSGGNDPPSFIADEKTTTVQVLDSSSNAVYEAPITATWYYEVKVDDTYYFYTNVDSLIDVTAGKASAQFATDSNGETILTYSQPSPSSGEVKINLPSGVATGVLVTRLYIKVSDALVTYQFSKDSMPETGSSGNKGLPAPEALSKGNTYLDTTASKQKVIANDLSVYINIKGSGSVTDLNGIELNAVWFYQKQVDSKYVITSTAPVEAETPGTVVVQTKSTGMDGLSLVTFRSPFVTPGSGYTCWLYIYALTDYFSFNYASVSSLELTASENPIDVLVSGMKGCVVSDNPASITAPLESVEKAYTIDISFTGPIPEQTVLTYVNQCASGKVQGTVETTSNTFKYIVRAGDSSLVTIAAEGYTFMHNGVEIEDPGVGFASASSNRVDNNFSSVYLVSTTDRDVPVIIHQYTIDNLNEDLIVQFDVKMGDNTYKTYVTAVGDTASIKVWGWKEQKVQSITATAAGVRIDSLAADDVVSAVKIVEKKILVFYSEDNTPTISNIVSDVTIDAVYKNKIYASAVSGTDGTASMNVPESGVTYMYKSYAIVPSAGTGVYDGYYVFNMYGYMSGAVVNTITVTVKYLSTSSLENISEPKCTKIVSVDDVTNVMKQGETQKFVAPSLSGFSFAGWYVNGEKVSGDYTCTFDSSSLSDGTKEVDLLAIYSAESVVTPTQGVDNSVIAIGIAAVVIALLGLIYVIFQSRRF